MVCPKTVAYLAHQTLFSRLKISFLRTQSAHKTVVLLWFRHCQHQESCRKLAEASILLPASSSNAAIFASCCTRYSIDIVSRHNKRLRHGLTVHGTMKRLNWFWQCECMMDLALFTSLFPSSIKTDFRSFECTPLRLTPVPEFVNRNIPHKHESAPFDDKQTRFYRG